MANKVEVDHVTGVETTGHEWDGIKELNKPLPRWWLWTFYVSIIWAIGYMVAYPAWPTLTDYTKGMLGYSQRATVAADVKRGQEGQAAFRKDLEATALKDIKAKPELQRFAMTAGGVSFQTNCAPCHGRGAQGFVGYPNLNDDDWIWGGKIEDIHETILYGIRNEHKKSRTNQMPRYGIEGILTDAQISDVADYVLSLSGKAAAQDVKDRGQKVFADNCAACHGDKGQGMIEQGAPNLIDGIWLYGGDRAQVVESIRTGRGGSMPSWVGRLDAVTLKSLAVYVHSLGGGK